MFCTENHKVEVTYHFERVKSIIMSEDVRGLTEKPSIVLPAQYSDDYGGEV